MNNVYVDSLEDLITILEARLIQGYYLRGQRDAVKWRIEPGIFRPGRLDDYIKKILVPKNYSYPFQRSVLTEWFNSREILDFVCLCLKERFRSFEQLPIVIKRLFELGAFLLRYNFYLGIYIKQNPNNHDFDHDTLSLSETIPYQVWATKEKFFGYIQYALPKLLDLIGLDGRFLQKGTHDNVITGYDQTFPQHYDFPTAVVDVTECYLTALHFAIDNGDIHKSDCFSIYAYKQLVFSDEAPVYHCKGDELKSNKRAQIQKGSFLYFRNPCTYYLEMGRFPSVDELINNCTNNELKPFADVIKFNVPYTNQILDPLHNLLKLNNINEKTLKPDNANIPTLIEGMLHIM